MDLIIRRSPVVGKSESEQTLAEAINVGDVHALLYQRGETTLADLLTAHLAPRDACDLAQLLRYCVRKAARQSIWRDYRTRLNPDEARAIGLVAAWYERAGAAGCRTWADLREGLQPPGQGQPPLQLLPPGPPEAHSIPGATDAAPQNAADSNTDDTDGGGIMPTWLHAPETSVWHQ